MKKLLGSLLLLSSLSTFADNNGNGGTYMSDMMNMDNMMYMDFGLGYGTASNWGTGSLGLNAMTMGFYYKPGLGVELGMDMLPNGNYQNNGAMINTFHVAAKGILPLSNVFNLYGKLGLGVNAGQGTATSNSMMMGMNMQNMNMITPVNVGPYYGAGMQFNLSKRFGIYIEDSGVIVVGGGNNGGFGNTNMTTLGLEIRM